MDLKLRRTPQRSSRFRPELLALEGRALLSVDVLTYQYNDSRTGANLQETTLTPANVNAGSFGLLANIPLDGKVNAQPLYVSNLAIPGQGVHNVMFVATENDSLYALDADDGQLLWHDGPSGTPTSLLPAGEIPVQAADLAGSQQFGAELGILDTPVIDPTTDTLYAEAESRSVVNGSLVFHQRIFAIDITTGAERVAPASIDQSITYPGANPVGNGSVVSFDPMQYKERDALTLSNGVVYTGWASNSDIPPYTGWIIGFNASNLGLASVLNIDPNGIVPSDAIDGPSGNTFWNSGGGFAVNAAGNLYNASANGPFDAAADDYGDSIIKFSTANGLAVSDYFTPFNQQMLSNEDGDLGSSDVILLPPMQDATGQTVQLAITAGKDGSIYVVNQADLGQFNATSNANAHQVLPDVLTIEELGAGAYFNGQVYYGANSQPLEAFTFTNSLLSTAPTSQTSESFGYPGTSPSISADGNANGIVWAVEEGSTAVLHAYNASDLADELYNSNQAADGRDQFGADSKFIVPTITDGHVYVGTQTGVAIFGLLPTTTPVTTPPVTTPPVTTPPVTTPPVTPAPPSVLIPAFSSANPLVGGLDLLGAVGADTTFGEPGLTYTWSAVSIPAGAPTPSFSGNGTNATKLVSVGIAQAGSYTFQVAIADPAGLVATSDVTIQVALPVPSIEIAPFFSAAPVAGQTVLLGVLGEDPLFPETSLTYTWVAISGPSGAPAPTFSSNSSNASKLEAVRFTRAGTYTLRVAVANPFDEITVSDVTVTVGASKKGAVEAVGRPGRRRAVHSALQDSRFSVIIGQSGARNDERVMSIVDGCEKGATFEKSFSRGSAPVKVTLISSSVSLDGVDQNQYLISYLFNGTLAIDAGCIGFYGAPEQQARIKDVLISHTHADHVASLPIFVENAFEGSPDPVTIHGSSHVLDGLQRDIFNGRIWPDFIGMSVNQGPFLRLNEIEANKPIVLQGLTITPIAVDHLVPTLGFLVDDGVATVVIASDTGPTDELWRVARATPHLKAVFLEAAFPNSMTGLANVSKHLTPAMFLGEARKLDRDDVDIVVVHIKPRFRAKILEEIQALGLPNLVIGRLNETYTY